jgi:hypothetical protein
MKRNLLMGSIICLTIVVTLAFQNCNSKQFAADSSNGVSGTLSNMDTDGTVDGVVDIITCKAGDTNANCPDSVTIQFYAVVDGAEVFINSAPAQETSPGSYAFSFTVPAQYKCKPIVAYVVHPETGAKVKLPAEATFSLWGNDPTCVTVTPPTNPPITPSSVPKVKIESVVQDGLLAEISGKCTDGADVVFSGDVYADLNKNASCSGGAFKFCTIMPKALMHNFATGKQSLNSQEAQDTADINVTAKPVVPLTFETFTKDGSNAAKLSVTGRCFTGGLVSLSIYGNPIADGKNLACVNGMFSYSGSPLLNVATRVLQASEATPFGVSVAIEFNVDGENTTPACAITSTVAKSNMCVQQAGSVKGTCLKGLPVLVYVNGKEQNFGVCKTDGTFDISNVALEKVGVANELKIMQKTPYGKSCTATKSMMNF